MLPLKYNYGVLSWWQFLAQSDSVNYGSVSDMYLTTPLKGSRLCYR